jgi:hypothetical protein
MKNSFARKQVGRVLIAALLGAAVFTCAMLITNFHIQSLGTEVVKHRWVYLFMPLQDIPYSFLLRLLHLSGTGGSEFCVLASIADGLMAFAYLLVGGFLWQLFRTYERDHRAVA